MKLVLIVALAMLFAFVQLLYQSMHRGEQLRQEQRLGGALVSVDRAASRLQAAERLSVPRLVATAAAVR